MRTRAVARSPDYPSPDERKEFRDQVCERCQRDMLYWTERVAWAQEMVQSKAVLLEVQTQTGSPDQPTQPVACTVLDLASGTLIRAGAMQPSDAPDLAQLLDQQQTPVLTWDGEGLWPLRDWAQAITGQLVHFGRMERLTAQLTHARQGERVVAWWVRPH